MALCLDLIQIVVGDCLCDWPATKLPKVANELSARKPGVLFKHEIGYSELSFQQLCSNRDCDARVKELNLHTLPCRHVLLLIPFNFWDCCATMMHDAATVSHKQQLRFAISGLCTRDLEAPSVAAARAVLRQLRHNKQHLRAALLDILSGGNVLHPLQKLLRMTRKRHAWV